LRLMESLATTETLAGIFSDESVLRAMLDFEIALARVQARLKIIPRAAARAIENAAQPDSFNPAVLAHAAQRAGTPAIPLVKALRESVQKEDPSAAGFVHWGATSQDVCDTALVLLLARAQAALESDLERLQLALRRVATKHRRTVMLGRTLLQPAPPVTFGLKAAGWCAAVRRGHARLGAAMNQALVLQLGGASGTLAALEKRGAEAGAALAKELKLGYPDAPWHSHRDRLAGVLCACGILAGTLGKMARDITLLMQPEIGEVSEAQEPGRGGSSSMPQKQNPAGCVVTTAAVAQVPALVASFLGGMVQEQERAAGAWQAEWSIVSRVVQATGLAVTAMAEIMENLLVDVARMRANIEATRGMVFAERIMVALSPKIGRVHAERILAEAIALGRAQNKNLEDVLAQMDEVNDHLDARTLRDMESPEQYLGAAQEFQDRLLSQGGKQAARGRKRRKD